MAETRTRLGSVAVAAAMLLAGCDKIATTDRVNVLENRVAVLEAQSAQQTARQAPGTSWVLWSRFIDETPPARGVVYGYTPFQAIGAYDAKSACIAAVTSSAIPGGTITLGDPIIIHYPASRQELVCLPQGTTAGVQPAK